MAGLHRKSNIHLQQHNKPIDWAKVNNKASAAALALKASKVIGVVAEVSADGTYYRAQAFAVHIPTGRTKENAHIFADANRMVQPNRAVNLNQPKSRIPLVKTKEPGRNEPCPCCSGIKYKRCHGR